MTTSSSAQALFEDTFLKAFETYTNNTAYRLTFAFAASTSHCTVREKLRKGDIKASVIWPSPRGMVEAARGAAREIATKIALHDKHLFAGYEIIRDSTVETLGAWEDTHHEVIKERWMRQRVDGLCYGMSDDEIAIWKGIKSGEYLTTIAPHEIRDRLARELAATSRAAELKKKHDEDQRIWELERTRAEEAERIVREAEKLRKALEKAALKAREDVEREAAALKAEAERAVFYGEDYGSF